MTGALIERVDRSDLHPAERLLGTSEAGIAVDGHGFSYSCDTCGVRSPSRVTEILAIAIAEHDGWVIDSDTGGSDSCPEHKPGQKLLSGKTAAPPKELSTPDAILAIRLEWLASKYLARQTPEATIRNSRASGHRTMLTDLLAGGVFERVFEQADGLAKRHPERVPEPFRETGMPGQEWLYLVLALVSAEDKA